MSFAEQERALFALLFDAHERELFLRDRARAFAGYALTDAERAELSAIDPAGLELDVEMRRELMLQRLARSFPLSFSITSSLPGDMEQLRALIDLHHVHAPAHQRAARFADALRARLSDLTFASPRERMLCGAIADAERGMAWTAANLRELLLAGKAPPEDDGPLGPDWSQKPLSIAPFVSVTMLPRALSQLKQQLCPCAPEALWARLCSTPLPAGRLSHVLQAEDPRLLVARAWPVSRSRCEAEVTHRLMELPGGFGPMLQHVHGKSSADDLLDQLLQASAPLTLLESVKQGFRRLVEEGMLLARG